MLNSETTELDEVDLQIGDLRIGEKGPLLEDGSEKESEQPNAKDSEKTNPSDSILEAGSIVKISGLESEQGKKINGQKGLVLAYMPEAGRYLLQVGKEKIKKRLKAANVHPTGTNADLLWDDIVLTAKLLGREVPTTRAKRVDICKFTFGRQIGAGPISRIILATKNPSYDMGEDGSINEVALKAISKEKLNDRRKAKMYQRALKYEKKTMYKCRGIHPFILNLYATAIGRDDVYFVLEYAPNKDLQKWSRDIGGFPESCVRFYTACIVDALEAMHKVKVYHRDVKPENVFLDKDYLPKLGDFGCSIADGDMITFMGTPQYMPPEMVAHSVEEGNVRATDYWSLGVTVYYLLYGNLCFGDGHDYVVMTSVRNCEYKMPEGGDDIIKDFIKKLVVKKIEDRMGWNGGWTEIKKHDIFKEIDWDTLCQAKAPPAEYWKAIEQRES